MSKQDVQDLQQKYRPTTSEIQQYISLYTWGIFYSWVHQTHLECLLGVWRDPVARGLARERDDILAKRWMFLTSVSHHECHWSVRCTFCSCPCWWIRGLAIITLPMWMLSFIWASTKHTKLHWHSRCETAVKDIQLCIHAAVDPERATQTVFSTTHNYHDKKLWYPMYFLWAIIRLPSLAHLIP